MWLSLYSLGELNEAVLLASSSYFYVVQARRWALDNIRLRLLYFYSEGMFPSVEVMSVEFIPFELCFIRVRRGRAF